MPESTVAPAELRARIEAVYTRALADSETRGALAWFARRARVTPRTLSRWLSGQHPPDPTALAVLELWEEKVGIT